MPLKTTKLKKAFSAGTRNNASISYYDAYRRRYVLGESQLVREYKRVAYTCANLNASVTCSTPLKLYLRKVSKNQKSLLRLGIETKSVSNSKKDFLSSQSYLAKTLNSFVDIEEVVVHPVLDLLKRGNDSPLVNGYMLDEWRQLYMEITGKAYWLVENDPLLGIPRNLWLLPSQWVTPKKESFNNRNIIDYFEYYPPGATKEIKYLPENIIYFRLPSLLNPYSEGLGWLEASFQANEVGNKLLSHEDSLLEKEGRPDAIISPKNSEDAFDETTAKRYEKEYNFKFAYGRSGGVWVPDEAIELTPVNFPPRDIARLEINKWSKNDIANAAGIPYALISDSSHNREQLEASEAQHAKYAIVPRCNRNAAILNDQLIPRYDDSGMLFLAYDDPVPENEAIKVTKWTSLVVNGIALPNEGRKAFDLPPVEGGDELRDTMSPSLEKENNKPSLAKKDSDK